MESSNARMPQQCPDNRAANSTDMSAILIRIGTLTSAELRELQRFGMPDWNVRVYCIFSLLILWPFEVLKPLNLPG